MVIRDLEKQIGYSEYYLKRGLPLAEAFPNLHRVGVGGQYYGPLGALKHAINLVWLACHQGQSSAHSQQIVKEMVVRSLEVYDKTTGEMGRSQHDVLLLANAIYLDDAEVLNRVTNAVICAAPEKPLPQYYESYCGVMKFWVQGEQEKAVQQLEIFEHHKGKEAQLRIASKSYLRSFLREDVKSLQRQNRSIAGQFWKRLVKQDAKPESIAEVELGLWDPNRCWPWPEYVLMRLLSKKGHSFKGDSLWMPEALLQVGTAKQEME
jgi:hypothetical protein